MTKILMARNDRARVSLDPHAGNRRGMIATIGKRTLRRAGSRFGRQILRGAPGGIFGGTR